MIRNRERAEKRRNERAKRKQMFEQLKLQAEVLCDTHQEGKQTIVLSRMMNIILDIIGDRRLNDVSRQALADHLTDCAEMFEGSVRLGGDGDRDTLYLDGAFRINDLAKRVVWTDVRTGRVLDVEARA